MTSLKSQIPQTYMPSLATPPVPKKKRAAAPKEATAQDSRSLIRPDQVSPESKQAPADPQSEIRTPQSPEPIRLRVRPDLLVRSRFNREEFDEEKLRQLVESIRSKGIMQDVIARDWHPQTIVEKLQWEEAEGRGEEIFEIVAGERRWRAAGIAGVEIPIRLYRGLSDEDAIEMQAIENMDREDLNALDEAEKYRQLLEVYKAGGLGGEEAIARISERLGRGRSVIYAGLNLLKLPETTRAEIRAGRLPKSHAELLTRLTDENTIRELTLEITHDENGRVADSPLPFRDARELVAEAVQREENLAEWRKLKAEFEAAGKKVLDPAAAQKIVQTYHGGDFGIFWNARDQWVLADMLCEMPGSDYRHYGKLWKKPPPEVLAVTEDGQPVIIYERKAADEAVKAGGKLKKAESGRATNKSPAEVKREREHKLRKKIFPVAIAQIVGSATTRPADTAFWKLFARLLFDGCHSHAWKGFCKRRGWDPRDKEAVDAHLAGFGGDQLRAALLELLIHDKCTPNSYDHEKWSPAFKEICAHYSVDLTRLEQVQTSGGAK
jgi:ParB/RepB/Spo0J family partition protein